MKAGLHLCRLAFAVGLASAQGGCVVQSQYQNGELVSRKMGLGIAQLPDCDASTSTLISTTALGAGVGRDRLQLGYVHADYACVPLQCKAVFWVEDAAVVDEVRALVGDDGQMCVANDKGEVVR